MECLSEKMLPELFDQLALVAISYHSIKLPQYRDAMRQLNAM